MTSDNAPVIIGGACQTWRDIGNVERTLIDALDEVTRLAMRDSGRETQVREDIDAIANVAFAMSMQASVRDKYAPVAPGKALLERWGRSNCAFYRTPDGGNVPQMTINHFAERVARGEHRTVLICSAELNATVAEALKRGVDISHWRKSPDDAGPPPTVGTALTGITQQEYDHGLFPPANGFALIDNAIRRESGRNLEQHRAYLGELFSRYNAVAIRNPNAWFREARSAREIATASEGNRYVAHPYTKYMCSVMSVNMGAALILTTAANARRLGVDESKLIYVNGCADVSDTPHLSERPELHDAASFQAAANDALEMAGFELEEIEHLDVYACFPGAVQGICNSIGVDPLVRQVTLTGGLPYYGGPGSSYSLHGAVRMMETLRAQRGTRGMLLANGWFLAKAGVGVYSTSPNEEAWTRRSNALSQQRLDARDRPRLATAPEGPGVVESYTVEFDRQGPCRGIVIGRLASGERFVANTRSDPALFTSMMNEDLMGRPGRVWLHEGKARFDFS